MKRLIALCTVIVGLTLAANSNATDKKYLVDFVVFNEGKAVTDREEYERRVGPALESAGFKKVQAYDLKQFMAGQLTNASLLNIYEMEADSFERLSTNQDYKKHIPFRNEVHDMDKLTLYTAEALKLAKDKQAGLLLVDLVVMNDGFGHSERFLYESKVAAIAEKYAMKMVSSFDIDSKISGIGPHSLKLNIWNIPNAAVMKKLGSDKDYQALISWRDEIHDLSKLTLYTASQSL